MKINRSAPRTDSQVSASNQDSVVISKTTDGHNHVAIDTNIRFTRGKWTCYPMTKGGPETMNSVKQQPGIAIQYRNSTRVTLLDRTDFLAVSLPSLNKETDSHVKEIMRVAMQDAGLDNSPENRRGLIRVLDELFQEMFSYDYDPFRKVSREIPSNLPVGVEMHILGPDGEPVAGKTT